MAGSSEYMIRRDIKGPLKNLLGEPTIYCAKVINHSFLALGLREENYLISSIYYVPGLGKGTVYKLSQLILITSLKGKY